MSGTSSPRYKCLLCQKTFTPGETLKRAKKDKSFFRLFKRWVTTGNKISDLTSARICSKTVQRYFYRFLDHPPQPQKLKSRKEVYLKIDGTYFKRWGCALVYKADQRIIFWDFVKRENYFSYYLNLKQIKSSGYLIKGITSDKHGSLIAAVKQLFPNIPHQHCLVHRQRSCQSLLTQKPQTEAGIQLLELVKQLNKITNHYEVNIWLKWLERLIERHESFVSQRTYGVNEKTGKNTWWYTHKNLRAAFRNIRNSKNNLFLYLDYPGLAKDTNGLEAEFSHLKRKLSLHRGLKRRRKVNFVKWYFYFKSISKNS